MSESAPLLSVQNVGFTFQGFGFWNQFKYEALTDISFDVQPGETFGVMGRNGCGKSTLLRILSGVIKPTTGIVETQCKGLSRLLLTLGLGFNPQLSGRHNALLSCMLQGASKKEALGLLEEIKAFSELENFFELPVRTYSSGMRSRLGFATATTVNVDLLLIDETLGVGDRSFNKKAEDAILSKIHGDQTVIFVSHNEKQVERLCERAVWLEGGCVAAAGVTSDVAMRYEIFMDELRSRKKRASKAGDVIRRGNRNQEERL